MPDQLLLPGFEPPGRAPAAHRLLFMIRLAGRAAADAEEIWEVLRRTLKFRGVRIKRDRLHITLEFIHDYPGPIPAFAIAKAIEAAERLSCEPFEVTFDEVRSYETRAGHHPLVLRGGEGLAALRGFQRALSLSMDAVGIAPKWAFDPHVTLAYGEQLVAPRPLFFPLSWTVTEFVLVESLVGLGQYNPLGRWTFKG